MHGSPLPDLRSQGPVVCAGDAHIRTWDGAAPVRLVVVDNVGHSFPAAGGRWGEDRGRYDAPGEIWDFFSECTG